MSTKTLWLLRHAKSSWDNPQLEDHERPLNARGRKAAKKIGQMLRDQGVGLELVLCSTSVRTRETAALVFEDQIKIPDIVFRSDLYHAAPDQIVESLKQVVEPIRNVLLIGHNPGLEDFVSVLNGEPIRLPTAALAQFDVEIESWDQLSLQSKFRMTRLWLPRQLRD